MEVRVIKATKQRLSKKASQLPGQKLRTCCYCRVSTDSDAQETSYEGQIQHFTEYINAHPDMELTGVYADEGITGTALKNREQFKKMIADCEAGQHDLILVKSISRWARNTIISLETIRKLRDLGIPIIFQKEGLNTMDSNSELLITILSGIAQQESDSISKNVRLGIQYLFQDGKPHLNLSNFLGLTKGKNCYELVIVPEEAVLVRRIYREFLEGYSPGMIAGRLTVEKIKTPAGKDKWYQSVIESILQNEKYCGDLLMQKWYVADFLSHRLVKNEGELPQYYVENHHEPIIPKDVFCQVHWEIERRSMLKNDPTKIRFGSVKALRGRLICGLCGRTLNEYKSPRETTWRCRKRVNTKQNITKEVEAACPCRIVSEKEIKLAIITAFNRLPMKRDELLRRQGVILYYILKDFGKKIQGLQERKQQTQDQIDSYHDSEKENKAEPESAEESCLEEELKQLEQEYRGLMLKRAEAANEEVHIRILLELVDEMRKHAGICFPIDTQPEDEGAACYKYDEFFRRTRHVGDEEIIGDDGKILSFSNDMVIKYLESVTVNVDNYEVKLKAGISETVPVGMLKL